MDVVHALYHETSCSKPTNNFRHQLLARIELNKGAFTVNIGKTIKQLFTAHEGLVLVALNINLQQ